MEGEGTEAKQTRLVEKPAQLSNRQLPRSVSSLLKPRRKPHRMGIVFLEEGYHWGGCLWVTRALCFVMKSGGRSKGWALVGHQNTRNSSGAQTQATQESCFRDEALLPRQMRNPAVTLISVNVAASCYWFDFMRPSLTLSHPSSIYSKTYVEFKKICGAADWDNILF